MDNWTPLPRNASTFLNGVKNPMRSPTWDESVETWDDSPPLTWDFGYGWTPLPKNASGFTNQPKN